MADIIPLRRGVNAEINRIVENINKELERNGVKEVAAVITFSDGTIAHVMPETVADRFRLAGALLEMIRILQDHSVEVNPDDNG